jgi:ornithine cyclodeaminase/alanine dehydrogenase-like protein (mu-crystallin family)
MTIPYICADDMRNGLTFAGLIDALRAEHLNEPPAMERTLMTQKMSDLSDRSYVAWHAWAHDDLLSVKLITVFPDNPRAQVPMPTVHALITLFDGHDGRPLALLDGTELTNWKTAAETALATDLLARKDAQSLLIVGAGALAPYHVRALLTARPGLSRIMVWNRSRSKAKKMVEAMTSPIEIVDDLPSAAQEADIIVTLTSAAEPLVRGAWLKPGTHLSLVGSFTPTMREVDDDVMRRGKLFVDTRQFSVEHCGDLVQPIAAGVISAADIQADLFALCQNSHPGRTGDEEITVFKNAGGAHLDMYAAKFCLACCADSVN